MWEPTRAPTQGPKTEGWAVQSCVPPIFPLPFGIGTHALNPSRRQPRATGQGKAFIAREMVSRAGATHDSRFSISGWTRTVFVPLEIDLDLGEACLCTSHLAAFEFVYL